MSSARIASPLCKSQHLIASISSGHYNCPVSDNGTQAGVAALALQTSTSELFCASQPRWAVVSTSSCWGNHLVLPLLPEKNTFLCYQQTRQPQEPPATSAKNTMSGLWGVSMCPSTSCSIHLQPPLGWPGEQSSCPQSRKKPRMTHCVGPCPFVSIRCWLLALACNREKGSISFFGLGFLQRQSHHFTTL